MTRQELAAFIRSQMQSPLSDDQLVEDYLRTHPGFQTEDSTSGDSGGFFSKAIPFTIRLAPAVAGSIMGGTVGSIIPGAGTAAGAALGGGVGSAAGEGAAQVYEYLTGARKEFSPGQMVAQGAIGAIPFGKTATVASAMGKGALAGAGSSIISDVIGDQQTPDLGKAALSGVAGSVFGAAGHAASPALESILSRFAPAEPSAAAKVAQAITTADDPQKVIEEVKNGLRFVKPTPYFDAPAARPRTEAELQSFKSIKFLPEDVRDDFTNLLSESSDQRRGVQPIAMSEAKATHKFVPLTALKPGTTMNVEDVIAHNEAWTNIGMQIRDLSEKIASGQGTNADRLALAQRMEEHKVIGLNYVGAVSEAARVLRGLQRPVRGMAVADSEFIDQIMKSPKFQDDMDKAAQVITAAGSDPEAQLRALLEARGRTKSGMVMGYLYNSILSGLKTPLRATLGDTFNLLTNYIAHPFAVGADVVRHAVTGAPRTMSLAELPHQAVGMFSAIPDAIKEALFVMKNGYSLKHVGLMAEFGGEKAVGQVPQELPGGYLTNFPVRNLAAENSFMYTLAYNQELKGAAFAKAKAAGMKTPGQIQEYMVRLLAGDGDSSKEVFDQAEKFAKKTILLDPSGPILKAFADVKSALPGPMQVALTFIAPVVRTPGKVLQRGFEASPVGFMMKGAQAGGREGAQALGRATMGTVALLPFMWLAAQGRLSGTGPRDPQLREQLLESGWRPNSVKVGDKWVSFQLFQPFATEMAVAGSAWDRFTESPRRPQDAQDSWKMAEQAITGAARSTLDQSYFSSLSAFFEAINDPDRSAGKFLRGVAQDVVPYSGLSRSLAMGVDSTIRQPQTASEAIKAIIPGLSSEVPARLNRYGMPVTRQGNALTRAANPVEVSPAVHDPVQDILDQTGVRLGTPTARITIKGQDLPLSREDKYAIQQAVGLEHRAVLERLQQRGGRLTDRMVEDALQRATRMVDDRAKMLLRRGQPLTREKLTRRNLDEMYQRYLDATGRES